MTGQGHASVRYRRALERRNVFLAETAAREMGQLSLEDSLGLVLLYADAGDPKFDRASVRWLSRLIEERGISTQQTALAATALLELRGSQAPHGVRLLGGLAGTRPGPTSRPGDAPQGSRSTSA